MSSAWLTPAFLAALAGLITAITALIAAFKRAPKTTADGKPVVEVAAHADAASQRQDMELQNLRSSVAKLMDGHPPAQP